VISADRRKRCPAGTMDAVSSLFGLCCPTFIGKYAASDCSTTSSLVHHGEGRRADPEEKRGPASDICKLDRRRASEVLDIKRPNREARQSGLHHTSRPSARKAREMRVFGRFNSVSVSRIDPRRVHFGGVSPRGQFRRLVFRLPNRASLGPVCAEYDGNGYQIEGSLACIVGVLGLSAECGLLRSLVSLCVSDTHF
jgi:hypothetical protein